jgi:tetratricopeptide (TPR) repeat protein
MFARLPADAERPKVNSTAQMAIAIEHHQAGRRQTAEQIYRSILDADSNQPDALHLLGVLAHERGNHQLAIDYIGQAIQLNENACAFHNNLGEAHRGLGNFSVALECYRRALALAPNYPEAHNNLGIVLKEQFKLDEALASYREALRLNPRSAETHNNLGTLFTELAEFSQAEAAFRASLQLQPKNVSAFTGLAEMLRGKLTDEDFAALKNRLADKQLDEQARYRLLFALALALDHRGDYAGAAGCLREANATQALLARQPYDPAAHEFFVSGALQVFDSAFFARLAGAGIDTQLPVFVFGLPRSGTTLIRRVAVGQTIIRFFAGFARSRSPAPGMCVRA